MCNFCAEISRLQTSEKSSSHRSFQVFDGFFEAQTNTCVEADVVLGFDASPKVSCFLRHANTSAPVKYASPLSKHYKGDASVQIIRLPVMVSAVKTAFIYSDTDATLCSRTPLINRRPLSLKSFSSSFTYLKMKCLSNEE